MRREKKIVERLLTKSGVRIGGDNQWDIEVHDDRLYKKILRSGSLGLGESYMDGWWSAHHLDKFIAKILEADLRKEVPITPSLVFFYAKHLLLNLQKKKAFEVGEKHYDIGNDLYETMLDDRLTYTCGYWREARSLDEAQEAKLDLIARKLDLKAGQRILDIGSGWGSFIGYAAEKYGVECVGVTVSKEQVEYANKRYAHLPVETRLQDYRDVRETFDHVVSVGMFEHVGYKNYRGFMEKVRSLLKSDESLFLLHTIGRNTSTIATDPWIALYIFPNGMLPSLRQITKATENLFVMEDWHNFGADYDTTLMHWRRNFNEGWDKLKSSYSECFFRMWEYYLSVSAASFRVRDNQLWQIVLSKDGLPGGYTSVR